MAMPVPRSARTDRCSHVPPRATSAALAALLAFAAAGCATPAAPVIAPVPVSASASAARPTAAASVTGTATYRERMALPPGAVFEAVIEDISKADAPSVVLGRTGATSIQVPVSFSIPYDPAKLDTRARYSVRARILVEDRLWFTSDTVHPVLRDAGDTRVEIVMRRVASAP
ncbi:MAG: YbaY family lipoprotein [Pseudomonadota bacterium]